MPSSPTDPVRPRADGRRRAALEAWCIGVGVAAVGPVWGAHRLDDPWSAWSELWPAALVLALAVSVSTAVIATARRVGSLEVAALLAWAHVPLAAYQLHTWLVTPPVVSSSNKFCACIGLAMWELSSAEVGVGALSISLLGLTTGAYALAVRRAGGIGSVLLPGLILAGMVLGGGVGSWRGVVLGGLGTLTVGTFTLTARGAREPAPPVSIKAARVLAVFAAACGFAIVALKTPEVPTEFLHQRVSLLGRMRSLVPAAVGCGVLLAYALLAGRRVDVRSRDWFVAVAMGGLLLVGGGRVLQLRLDAFELVWAHVERHRVEDLEASLRLMPDAHLVETPLPWPLPGVAHELSAPPSRIAPPIVIDASSDRCDLPVLRVGEGPRPVAHDVRLVADDNTPFGDVVDAVMASDASVKFAFRSHRTLDRASEPRP